MIEGVQSKKGFSMQVLGLDIGFGFTKATDGRQHQIFKSVVGEAAEAAFMDSIVGPARESYRHIEVGGEGFFVGELAESASRGRGFTLDQSQLLARYAKVLAAAALSPMVKTGEPLRVVTGLPISFLRRHRDGLAALLQQRHAVKLVSPNGEREEKQIHIEKVRVIPQPFGSLFNHMLNHHGKPSVQRFVTEKIGIIDIGFRTADYAISDRTRYSERGSQSSDAGISLAYSAIANALTEKSGVQVELYRLYDSVTRGSVKIKGKRYDLNKLVQQSFQALATRIANEVNRLWADDWDLDAVLLAGGGGAALAPFLQPLIEHELIPIDGDTDPRLMNVNGYYKYGMHVWPEAASAPPQS
jgi:plasmid segregation protein ParM